MILESYMMFLYAGPLTDRAPEETTSESMRANRPPHHHGYK
jgi:hypothetical protein